MSASVPINLQQISPDLREVGYCGRAVPLTVRPLAATEARESALVEIFGGEMNEVVFEVKGLQGDSSAIFPIVVTWELFLGGVGILESRRALMRKTTLLTSRDTRTGRMIGYKGPSFRRVVLVGYIRPQVSGAEQRGRVECFVDVLVSKHNSVRGESVVVGSAIG